MGTIIINLLNLSCLIKPNFSSVCEWDCERKKKNAVGFKTGDCIQAELYSKQHFVLTMLLQQQLALWNLTPTCNVHLCFLIIKWTKKKNIFLWLYALIVTWKKHMYCLLVVSFSQKNRGLFCSVSESDTFVLQQSFELQMHFLVFS